MIAKIKQVLFICLASLFSATAQPSNDLSEKTAVTIFLGVDGLSYQAFQIAQKRGLFQAFKNTSQHITPFPTMTDLTWSTLTKTAEIFGPTGRIRTVEATYFDESSRSIQGDPRDYYRRLAFPKYYLNAFQNFFNPYVEGLMYFPTKEMARIEIDHVVDAILKSKETLITGYIGGIDSTAHTQLNRLFPVLVELDRGIRLILDQMAQRKQPVEIILISDHGNIGRFEEGKEERELLAVDIKPFVEQAGFHSVQKLKEDRDIAIPMLALGTWAPVYFQNRSHIDDFLTSIRQAPWFDLAVHLKKNSPTEVIIQVTGVENAIANVLYDKIRRVYHYQAIVGNPLQLPETTISHDNHKVPLLEKDILAISSHSPYPDSLKRLIDSVSNKDFDFPDLILTLKDGYFLQNSLSAFTKMYRTHGSLTKASTYGILASTQRKLPSSVRTQDVLSYLHIDPKSLFGEAAITHNQNGKLAESKIFRQTPAGIETKAREFSEKRIFQILSRFIADSRSYFVISEIQDFLKAFNLDPLNPLQKNQLNINNFNLENIDIKTLLTSNDIGALTDVIINNPKAPLSALANDPRIKSVQEKFAGRGPQRASLNSTLQGVQNGDPAAIEPINTYLVPGKRSVMKAYQLPYLLERALVLPEKSYLPETRDLPFARYWNENQEEFTNGIYPLDTPRGKDSVASSLFTEVLREQQIEEKIFPTPLHKLYNRRFKDLTIVYIPGIYNSLFDREIFSLGLASIKEDLGLRVIVPPVESICAAEYNGEIILSYLKDDRQRRLERGFAEPHYLILGYSKGAVDTLHAIVKDRDFFAKNVNGLISIASPLHGSSILDKTDLPFSLVDLLSEKQGPSICHKEKASGPSISPAAMEGFWRKHERSLIGITRYFSVTFKSEPENSHIFMRATKLIAQFDEDNDGVVTESSSKFPTSLGAIDLGSVEADHLAGILSSKFDQKSFMRALVNTAAELDLEDRRKNLSLNSKQILKQYESLTGKARPRLSLKSNAIELKSSLFTLRGILHPLKTQQIVANTAELNKLLIPVSNDPANDYQSKVKLPGNQLKYDPYRVIDVQKLSDIFAQVRITPNTPENTPQGIRIELNHENMVHFRMDHQFNYESRSPLRLDNNEQSGYKIVNFQGDNFLLMRSNNNSIRMTTLSYRFRPTDFPNMDLKLAVTKGVQGADPVLGGAGRDDSAFQVWFTVRYGEDSGDRSLVDSNQNEVILFGYYWGDPAPNGEARHAGEIFENWYSKRNVIIATLPESKQLLLNEQEMLGQVVDYKRNLAEDLKRAFPDRDLEKMEILAITIQHDSNDSKDYSEAYFKKLDFLP